MRLSSVAAQVVSLVLATTVVIQAGSKNRTGTGGASELTIPIGVRSIAMGNATVATATGIDALFYNPAGLAKGYMGTAVYFSHMTYIADIGVDCGAVSVDVPSLGTIAFQVVGFSIGEIPITTADLPDGFGATYSPQFITGGLTYATRLTDRIAIGFTATVISETMAEVSATGVALNAGAIYDNLAGVKGLQFGVALKNVGPQMKFQGSGLNVKGSVSALGRPPYFYKVDAAGFELPSSFELGMGYTHQLAEGHSIVLCGAFQNNNFSDDAYRMGGQYEYKGTLFLRAGYDYIPSPVDRRANIFGATFGVGLEASLGTVNMTFDYAYRTVKFFGGNQAFSLTVGI